MLSVVPAKVWAQHSSLVVAWELELHWTLLASDGLYTAYVQRQCQTSLTVALLACFQQCDCNCNCKSKCNSEIAFPFNAHFIYTEWIAAIYFGTWKYNCKSMDIIVTST